MDLSGLSDEDLAALQAKDLTKVSDAGLSYLQDQHKADQKGYDYDLAFKDPATLTTLERQQQMAQDSSAQFPQWSPEQMKYKNAEPLAALAAIAAPEMLPKFLAGAQEALPVAKKGLAFAAGAKAGGAIVRRLEKMFGIGD